MEAGLWSGKGCSAPWMYHRIAGQYTLFQKQLVSDFAPDPRRPSPRVLQDSTNWHDAQPPPPPWGALRQENPRLPGKEWKRAAAGPKPHDPRSPTRDGFCRRELAWGAAAHSPKVSTKGRGAPGCSPGPLGAGGKIRGDWPARSPPSYEAHMRLRAVQGPRKENCPRRPPPYVAPPSYEAAHRTVRPQTRACRTGERPPAPAEAPSSSRLARACQGRPRTPSSGWKNGHCQAAAPPGPWSYLAGARTWAGRRRRPERAEASPGWPGSPAPRGHTLPRVTRRLPASCCLVLDASAPQAARPSGGRSNRAAAAWPGPEWKRASSREPGGTRATPRRGAGGVMVIDATCVVIQTHYIPPARPERVRYVGREEGPKEQSPPAPAAASPGSLAERASRILGLPWSELSFPEQGGQLSVPASPRREAAGGGPEEAPAQPERALSPPQGSLRLPFPQPTPKSGLEEPPDTGLPRLEEGRVAHAGPSAPRADVPQNGSYVLDLRKAMSRIRRHTAPDSDTDEELEKARRPAGGHFSWKGRLNEAALSYSSSSLESIESNATVVSGNAKPATLSNGPEKGWQPSPTVP
ncbi:dendrin isoform X2 [Sphaerodactylus townsendi]|nr:dendrin isoform X2 [Sphaerodactylus townsendi]